ncbi:CGNR zinc finger domain-containing protein [Actinospica robiniae]|uniref:CGNR zinc finger domain-containing protein n=1 Tax=Actinospica robiniae TaxID=304901 RepID=UPI00054CF2C0|nr:CGNR zinc finger domain-containing protein [Actinospica robiniae]
MAGESAQVEADTELLAGFLNTLDQRSFSRRGQRFEPHDELDSPAALGRWLTGQGLVAQPRATAADLADALALRAGLRENLRAALEEGLSADPAAAADPAEATGLGYPLRLAADPSGELSLVCTPPRSGEASQALATLVAAVATAAIRGGWRRVRLCAAPECRWAFVDTSRRGDRRWCSAASCGNRHKTADYRARGRTGSSGVSPAADGRSHAARGPAAPAPRAPGSARRPTGPSTG